MTPAQLREARDWLLQAKLADDGGTSLMDQLVEMLRARDVPLWRASFSLITKHPELVWRTVQWVEGASVKVIDRARGTLQDAFFTTSPVALLRGGAPQVRVRLVSEAQRFPICEDLRAEGGTDYVALALPFANGEVGYISFATRGAEGFSETTLDALVELGAPLARLIELASAYHGTRALLGVYLGNNAGERVASGQFRRGGGELIDAVIWFCDMRGFTELSDTNPPDVVVRALDEYFDRVAGPIMDHGGEVLKFVGDAILAIFPVGSSPREACARSLQSAVTALEGIEQLNVERAARGEGAIAIGVALHLGRVMYGNIGARSRLDFTAISAAVNEACRLEGLCKPLRAPLLLSEAFSLASHAPGLVDLGAQSLKGVREPLRVFTVNGLATTPTS